ncbi:hypothetical protein IFR04_003254 [Cadophora malorum]|uniref:Protein kinase domain-containing protein n=1 Tax=Cadophora malorum TaxID=108018 RepID=A0A8H7WEX3_9HELO|nr:hypothetical protein IFR04_003254 [Cadophora malorum]
MIRQLHHKNLVPIHEVFASQQGFFIISPYMDISLERINGSPRYPCEPQLAELSREILYGISYLASEGWTHSNINCSNVLLSLKDVGGARITDIECCSKSAKGAAGRIDSKALGIVMMKVMEKDSQPKGSFGLRHPERWSEDAVEFLSMTQVSTPEKLAQHQFVANYKQHGSLVRLIAFTNVAAFGGFYNYDKSAELF